MFTKKCDPNINNSKFETMIQIIMYGFKIVLIKKKENL